MCHAAGKKFYLTMNVFPFDDQMDDFVETARIAHEIGVDAAIVSDLGAIVTLREHVPGLTLHVSTQASTVNSAAVRHYGQLGCERVILARETSIQRAKAIHEAVPQVELETFVHGASCVAWSGRCLLSAVLAGRSGNQGECAQPCASLADTALAMNSRSWWKPSAPAGCSGGASMKPVSLSRWLAQASSAMRPGRAASKASRLSPSRSRARR